jgi:hypothetical protein
MLFMPMGEYCCLNFTRKKIKHIFFLAILFIFSLYITTHTLGSNQGATSGKNSDGTADQYRLLLLVNTSF